MGGDKFQQFGADIHVFTATYHRYVKPCETLLIPQELIGRSGRASGHLRSMSRFWAAPWPPSSPRPNPGRGLRYVWLWQTRILPDKKRGLRDLHGLRYVAGDPVNVPFSW